jgi:hypothetical protein
MKRLRGGRRAYSWGSLLPLIGVLSVFGPSGCRGRSEPGARARGAATASVAAGSSRARSETSAGPVACRAPASLAADAEAAQWFPVTVAGFCIDPNADVRRYGGKSHPPLAGACAALGVECEPPQRLGLARVVSVRYLEATGAAGQITASLWSFDDPETALAYLTERVAVELELGRLPVVIDAGAGGVQVGSSALFVRGGVVGLLELEDERSTPADRARRAATVLPELAKTVGARLPGPLALPRAVDLLPREKRTLLELRYEGFDLLGIVGVGRGARAHYEEPDGPHDVIALVRADDDAADDVMVTLRKVDGARKLKQAPYGAVRLRQTEGTKQPIDWVFGRKGTVVLGVGAPVVVVPKKKGAPKPPDKTLLRMKRLLDRVAGR